MKQCNRCNEEKEITEFYKNSKRVYPYCKVCAKKAYAEKHYQANKETYKEKSRKSAKNTIQLYKEYKATLSCTQCGESRPWCLAFHHTDPKEKDIEVAKLVGMNSRKRLQAEIDKCIVLCHNCHSDLHYQEKKSISLV